MYVNLHTLPANKAMYTVSFTWEEAGSTPDLMWTEEIDVVAPRGLTALEVAELTQETIEKDYEEGARVIGVANQSDGYVMWKDPNGDLLNVV